MNKFYQVEIGCRIAQIVLEKILTTIIEEVYDFDNCIERGIGGFGSTNNFWIIFLRKKKSWKVANKYVPPYKNLHLPWCERDGLLTYIDQLKYKKFIENPDDHFSNVEIINFDIIHHECSGKLLEMLLIIIKLFDLTIWKIILKKIKKTPLSAACRSGGKDLWIQRDLIIEHFKNLKLWLLFALVFLNSTK